MRCAANLRLSGPRTRTQLNLCEATKAQVQQTQEERAFWESMAAEAEAAKA